MSTPKVQRTYGSRNRRNLSASITTPSSPPSLLASSPPPTRRPSRPAKRSFSELLSEENVPPLFTPSKRLKALANTSANTSHPKAKAKATPSLKSKLSSGKSKQGPQKTLTQLHFNIDQPILRTCPLCDLSYTRGAPDDEHLHRAHCTRVRQGLEWGRDEEKDKMRGTENVVMEVRSDVKLKESKKKGRIVCFPADVGGKVGAKLETLLQTINLSLSSPALPPSVLQCSKAYLFLIPHETQNHRERIVGCVIAQRITTAMAVVNFSSSDTPASTSEATRSIIVDSETNLFCSPTQLPTPMGIPRLFVTSSHRRLGIARALLDTAADTFVYGCPLDPTSGQVAFSQPTGMGQSVMKSWGKGGVRVFEE